MRISATPSFLRQANKTFKRNPDLRKRFEDVINRMIADPFEPSLKTHKLKGGLREFWSCSIKLIFISEIRILPSKLSFPAKQLKNVVFPDPFLPTKATLSFGWKTKLTCSNKFSLSKPLDKSCIEIIVSVEEFNLFCRVLPSGIKEFIRKIFCKHS